jgi:hypothetical protein
MRLRPASFLLVACVVAIAVAGCTDRPVAPALLDTPFYQNKQEGFRFEAPDGWKMTSRGEYPPGPVEKERLLVEYRRLQGGPPASLRVSLIDLPPSAETGSYLRDRPIFRSLKAAPVETISLGGQKAERFVFEDLQGKGGTIQEVVVVRRGERVYFFSGGFAAGDKQAREQFRRVVGSLVWG